MLVAGGELLLRARREGYAVGAFNIQNLEGLWAVTGAAVEERSPVIVAVSPGAIRYGGLRLLATAVRTVAEDLPVPLALHLDHGEDLETVSRCLEAGFTSVMIDGSHLPFRENVDLTRKAVELAHPRGVSVEGELGRLAGMEEKSVEEREALLTDPAQAEEFVRLTGVDSLAVSIGTSHGAYKFRGEPRLDFERLKLIRERVEVPLVLHGASSVPPWAVEKASRYGAQLQGAKGIPEEHLRRAISLGIAKVNIDTDLRLAFTATVREVLATSPGEFDPRKILGPAREAMKEVVREKMRLFGSSGRAAG
ncbi:MAG: class II fructose-1,6-bisphosphate aldolase [Hadesarchaea archaeon]|jgi:fructose-bisphosphate aldolase class II|nr:MAG: class II fructose-1,6-bisphosphate aldolase [Hadesarchaea archaeon]